MANDAEDDGGVAELKAELEALKAKIAAGIIAENGTKPCPVCGLPFPSHSWNCSLDQQS